MNFGSKMTPAQKAAMVEKRLGATTKGTAEKAKPTFKAKPTGGLKNPGIKATWKF